MVGIITGGRVAQTCLVLFFLVTALTSAFLLPTGNRIFSRSGLGVAKDIERPSTFLDEKGDSGDLGTLFLDEDEEDGRESSPAEEKGAGRQRWENLNPKIKKRLIEKGQTKAITNKKKREPAGDRKRREYEMRSFYGVSQIELTRIYFPCSQA